MWFDPVVLWCVEINIHGQNSDLHAIKINAWGVAIFQGGMRNWHQHCFLWATKLDANCQFTWRCVALSTQPKPQQLQLRLSQTALLFYFSLGYTQTPLHLGVIIVPQEGKCWYIVQLGKSSLSEVPSTHSNNRHLFTVCLLFVYCLFTVCLLLVHPWFWFWKGALSTSARMWAFGRGAGGQPKPSVPIGGIRNFLKWGFARFVDCKSNRHDFNISTSKKR